MTNRARVITLAGYGGIIHNLVFQTSQDWWYVLNDCKGHQVFGAKTPRAFNKTLHVLLILEALVWQAAQKIKNKHAAVLNNYDLGMSIFSLPKAISPCPAGWGIECCKDRGPAKGLFLLSPVSLKKWNLYFFSKKQGRVVGLKKYSKVLTLLQAVQAGFKHCHLINPIKKNI
jgi:hypothetical protein